MYQQGYRPPVQQKSRKKPAGKTKPNRPSSNGKPVPRPGMNGYKPLANGAMVMEKKRRSGAGKVFLLVVVLGLLVFGAFYLKTWLDVRPYDNVFAPNVYVDNIPLEGMTAEEGIAAVRAKAQSIVGNLTIRLMAGDHVYATIDNQMLGITYDTDTALNKAWSVGHKGTIFDRKRELDQVRAQGLKTHSATPGANTDAIDEMLIKLKNDVYRAPKSASFSFNPDASDPFDFIPEVQGMSLDIEPLKQEIYDKVNSMESGDVQIVPTYTQPEYTEAILRESVALRYRATTPIDPKSIENRTNNIRRAFEKISGEILSPGEKLSFNSIVGARTEKNGFFPAPEYAYGELETGIGGGVCQASTTLYLAAICSGLQIIEREPHSDPVSYTDFGKDATVYYSRGHKIDFVFKNNTDGNIYITAAVKTDPANRKRFYCEVSIYGPSLGDVSYELVTNEIRKIPAPTEPDIVQDKQHKYTKKIGDEYTVFKARDGHVVVAELVKYEDGVEVERTQVSEDTYKERAERVYVGVE